jgi:hypothetical protein
MLSKGGLHITFRYVFNADVEYSERERSLADLCDRFCRKKCVDWGDREACLGVKLKAQRLIFCHWDYPLTIGDVYNCVSKHLQGYVSGKLGRFRRSRGFRRVRSKFSRQSHGKGIPL